MSVQESPRLTRQDGPWLAGLLVLGLLALGLFVLSAQRLTRGQGGVPLDDAWIHFQFARNLAHGDGLSFNPGQPTSGSTAPLWTLLLAAVYFAGGRFPVAGQILSALGFLAAIAATYVLGKQLTGQRWAAGLAGAVVAVNGRAVWAGLSALETPLFMTLSLLALVAYLDDRADCRYRLRTAVLFGLAALARPEGYLLFALSAADCMGWIARSGRWRRLPWLPTSAFVAVVLPYLLFSLQTGGRLLPNTYHAKVLVNFLPDRDFLSLAARYLILDNPLLLPFYVLGLGALLRRAPLLSLWSAGLPVAYAFLHATLYQHGRYLIPLIPVNAAIAVAGLLELQQLALQRGWLKGLARSLAGVRQGKRFVAALLAGALVVAGTAWRLPTMAGLYAWNVDNINRMHVALGRWVAENTPPGAVLALNDIGAIAYISERPVVDLAGLVTPEVVPLLHAPDRDTHLVALMAARGVQVVIIFPNWFPDLAARTDLLEPVYRVTLARNTIAGGETMVVYRAQWQR